MINTTIEIESLCGSRTLGTLTFDRPELDITKPNIWYTVSYWDPGYRNGKVVKARFKHSYDKGLLIMHALGILALCTRHQDLIAPRPGVERNRARCKVCGDEIQSRHRHDYVACKCGKIAVDGGLDYRRIKNPEFAEVLHEPWFKEKKSEKPKRTSSPSRAHRRVRAS